MTVASAFAGPPAGAVAASLLASVTERPLWQLAQY